MRNTVNKIKIILETLNIFSEKSDNILLETKYT